MVISLFLGLIVVSLAPYQVYWLIGIGGFITTFGIPIFGTIINTTLQIVVPNEKLGRFGGFISAIMSLFTPIGYLASGGLAEHTGITPLFIGASSLAILAVFIIWMTSKIGNLEKIVIEKMRQIQLQQNEQ